MVETQWRNKCLSVRYKCGFGVGVGDGLENGRIKEDSTGRFTSCGDDAGVGGVKTRACSLGGRECGDGEAGVEEERQR